MADTGGMNRAEREACWRERIGACAASGLGVARYCREAGISVAGYYRWRRELGRRDAVAALPSLFAELRPVPAPCAADGAPIEISLAGGRMLRVAAGFDGETLARVVRVLEGL
ncbi:MAG: IS66 family insertion sequence element accessory protein TnpB [Candidatus Hydrogenedens sp.]|nr:IS66 family insertion sequence element accessory protein TnpB [Candidatus Hydrogenedens sp.]